MQTLMPVNCTNTRVFSIRRSSIRPVKGMGLINVAADAMQHGNRFKDRLWEAAAEHGRRLSITIGSRPET